jgi:hypothetical protein
MLLHHAQRSATALYNPMLDKLSHNAVLCIIWGGLRATQDEFERALQQAEQRIGKPLRHLFSSTNGGTSPVSTVSAMPLYTSLLFYCAVTCAYSVRALV